MTRTPTTLAPTLAPLAVTCLLLAIALSTPAFGSETAPNEHLSGGRLSLEPNGDFERALLRVVGPDGYLLRASFDSGEPIAVDLLHEATLEREGRTAEPWKAEDGLPDGRYRYQLTLVRADGETTRHGRGFSVTGGRAGGETAGPRARPRAARVARRGSEAPSAPGAPIREASAAGSTSEEYDIVDVDGGGTHLTLGAQTTPVLDEYWHFVHDGGILRIVADSDDDPPGTDRMVFVRPGVANGLGTSAPNGSLHIEDNASPEVVLENTGGAEFELETDGDAFYIKDDDNQNRFVVEDGDGARQLVLASNGFVGVGTDQPTQLVDVVSPTAPPAVQLTAFSGAASDASMLIQRRARGEIDQPTGVLAGDRLGGVGFRGHDGAGFGESSSAAIEAVATEVWSSSARGTRLVFSTTAPGESVRRPAAVLTADGRFLVWPSREHSDYVFDPGYDLMELDELRDFIARHSRLPNVPSAEQVEEDGYDLAAQPAILLEKIEELVLYLLEQDDALQTERDRSQRLEQRLDELEEDRTLLEERLARLEGAVGAR